MSKDWKPEYDVLSDEMLTSITKYGWHPAMPCNCTRPGITAENAALLVIEEGSEALRNHHRHVWTDWMSHILGNCVANTSKAK